ncbi:hypothetical protein H0H92_005594 [Tricholoma furcatifolium]|nr:hypothetical protein H0H92_005594 [Tricholoma furcatifolium]
MANTDYHQAILSEQMLLLHECKYSDLVIHHDSNKQNGRRDANTNREVRLLDTIAVALTTGNPGDVYAAAFDRRGTFQLILAKNGPPNEDDMAAASEFISLIQSPQVTDYIDAALQTYKPLDDFEAEFPVFMLKSVFKDPKPPFNTLWRRLVVTISERAAKGLPQDFPSALEQMSLLFFYAETISHSTFLKSLVQTTNLLHKRPKERAEKFKQRLDKVSQYVKGIDVLLQRAKKLPPISHRWVTDDFTGTGEGTFTLCDDPLEVIARGLNLPSLSPQIEARVFKLLPSIQANWERQKTVNTRVHAELRIILHFGPALTLRGTNKSLPIGVSKRSCFGCTLWMEHYNSVFNTRWMTRESHGKPCANWALPGTACSWATVDMNGDSFQVVDMRVAQGVSVRLSDMLDWLIPGSRRTRTDEHVSSGDESSEMEIMNEAVKRYKTRTR